MGGINLADVSKATGRPLAKIAAKVMAGKTLDELGATDVDMPRHVAVKQSVFPFAKFPGDDPVLGPEMRSTGEVMGFADDFGSAFAKASYGAGLKLPLDQLQSHRLARDTAERRVHSLSLVPK